MIPIHEIISAGSRFYGVPVEELRGRNRRMPLPIYRVSVWGACRAQGHALATIGEAFARDHGTVLWSIDRISPHKFGEHWTRHLRFVEHISILAATKHNPSAQALTELNRILFDIDAQIKTLTTSRAQLIAAREQLREVKR